MTDDEALLAGILADPDADLPRLVYADFLEETGDAANIARAEFIRVQIELAILPAEELSTQAALTWRIQESVLLKHFAKIWLAEFRTRGEFLQNTGTHGLFRRGFLEIVWMPAIIFTTKAQKLFARAPVRELRVTRTTLPELAVVLAQPHVRKLHTLDLCDRSLGDDVARMLAESDALPSFQRLILRGCNLTDAGAIALAETPQPWQPTRIDLTNNSITPLGLARLVSRFPMRNLDCAIRNDEQNRIRSLLLISSIPHSEFRIGRIDYSPPADFSLLTGVCSMARGLSTQVPPMPRLWRWGPACNSPS